jgi:dipeptidyl aminopeptidase/acylaminoacyl peptidase
VEREPGGEFVALTNCFAEIDDPDPAPDGRSIVVASGREQVTAGGGHNDHVFQLYLVDPETREWHRLTRSHRAESLPRFTADGGHVVFVRRAEYDGWSLDDPWGPGSIFVVAADGTDERRLTEGLFHPFDGLELVARDTRVVFGALPEGSTEPSVFALDFPAGGEPRLLIEDAYLPTPIPGTEELLVARVHEDGHGIARIDLEGRVAARVSAARERAPRPRDRAGRPAHRFQRLRPRRRAVRGGSPVDARGGRRRARPARSGCLTARRSASSRSTSSSRRAGGSTRAPRRARGRPLAA